MLRFFHFHIFFIDSQIWLTHFMDDHPCGLHHKIEKKQIAFKPLFNGKNVKLRSTIQ